jgi:hypothetical protein
MLPARHETISLRPIDCRVQSLKPEVSKPQARTVVRICMIPAQWVHVSYDAEEVVLRSCETTHTTDTGTRNVERAWASTHLKTAACIGLQAASVKCVGRR